MPDEGQLDALAFLRVRRGLETVRTRLDAGTVPAAQVAPLRRRLAALAAAGPGDLDGTERALLVLLADVDRLGGSAAQDAHDA